MGSFEHLTPFCDSAAPLFVQMFDIAYPHLTPIPDVVFAATIRSLMFENETAKRARAHPLCHWIGRARAETCPGKRIHVHTASRAMVDEIPKGGCESESAMYSF